MHSLPFLDDVNFVFVVASLSVDRAGTVTNFYSVLVQYDCSLVWLFGLGNHLSLLFCDDGMPYRKIFQLHNTVLISATDERNHYRNFHCTGTCSDQEVRKAKALGCQRQPLKSQNLHDRMNYFRRLQEYEPRGALPPTITCNMRKITSKTGHNFITRKRTNSFGYELQFVKFV